MKTNYEARLILVHGGTAHMDDFIAASLALAVNPEAALERRDPTQEELDDPNVWVLDQGDV